MAIIPSDTRFIGIADFVDLTERRSAQVNSQSEPYTMTDIVDTVSAGIPTGADWGEISGTLSNQIDLQSALDSKQDDLVSGTNIKTINGSNVLGSGNLQITTTDQWGDITGTLSNQTDLQNALNDKQVTLVSGTNIKTINGETLLGSTDIETALVNPTSTFLPINTSGAFADSPLFATKEAGYEGYNLFETKINDLSELPVGGIEASQSWGISAELNFASFIQRVQLGDFDNYTSVGKFEWSTGGNAPANASYIKFDTFGYDLFECTKDYFVLDSKFANDSTLIDGVAYAPNLGFFGFGAGLNTVGRTSLQASIFWDFYAVNFKINGIMGDEILFSNLAREQTYIAQLSSKLGIELSSMYISNDLTTSNAVAPTEDNILKVRDDQGNTYGIKLYPYI